MRKTECPDCGTTLTSELMDGLCPRCLLKRGMPDGETDTEPSIRFAETLDSDSTPVSSESHAAKLVTFDLASNAKDFGGHELISEIARGGMGVVYRARDRKLGREVALKVILSGQFASANDVRRFHMEAESAASLDHPGIVPIYEIGEQDGHHFYTMKLVSGGSFAERMPELREDIRDFALKIASVAEAVDYAHRRGILHRDIKPANLLFDEDDRPLVTDLGLAKQIQSESDLTGTGAIVGTPAYMPPEQASASKEVTTSADVYAIGAILYEGLVGTPPHQGESAVQTLMMAAKGDVRRPSEINRKVDRTLELICMKCLALDPADRYESAGLLAKDLKAWQAGEPVSVRPKSFASSFNDVLASQFRSALGAMFLGLLGGLSLGIPCYCGIAAGFIGEEFDDIQLGGIGRLVPPMKIGEAWWLHPPEWIGRPPTFVCAFAFVCLLGWLIQKLVRPQDTRHAIALGLVAGLLMTIVQFMLFGTGVGFMQFQAKEAGTVHRLALASLGSEPSRKIAVQKLYEEFPEIKTVPLEEQGDMLTRHVALKFLLNIPYLFVLCLLICLTIAMISCVVGTFHAHRISNQGFGIANQFLRYSEVMIIFALIGVSMIFTIVYALGISTNFNLDIKVFAGIFAVFIATLPGLFLAPWYFRWPVYVAMFAIAGGWFDSAFS